MHRPSPPATNKEYHAILEGTKDNYPFRDVGDGQHRYVVMLTTQATRGLADRPVAVSSCLLEELCSGRANYRGVMGILSEYIWHMYSL